LRLLDSGITRLVTVTCAVLLAAGLATAQETASQPDTTSHSSAPAHKTSSKHKKSHKSSAKSRTHGQKKIDAQRAQEIQEALIREHYLDGKPTGVWSDSTEEAMKRYQADNGWQSKTTPDARALIKLGLGPDHQHLLNPESAMTSQPETPHGASSSTTPRPQDPSARP
jgi:peptidoglycan hydrolase-like protein with peptidoglycan-binding domain